ncbi:D-2-hydroxyglutarate dehydrogenase [Striga asiatica]|uniref:D-2-hydroxyglutarate dehydrogenase n=1 Tax=Striga asiatica TaxID=4170 RepID=A0A5A7NYW8_STRAF|nr:D-2-hydroxyglutarate dehydrogenase [Striga asiatica]
MGSAKATYTAAYRLLRRSSRNLFDRRADSKFFPPIRSSAPGLNDNSIPTRELSEQDVYYHKTIVSMRSNSIRGFRIGIPNSCPEVRGLASQFNYRGHASMASTPARNQSFSAISCDDINYFKKILGEKGVVQEEAKLDDANTDWMRKFKGSSKLMLQPRSTQEVDMSVGPYVLTEAERRDPCGNVSQILTYCNSRCLAVVPQGGNTGLVGGSVPVFDEVIINLSFMNEIISFDKASGILVLKEAVKLGAMSQLMLGAYALSVTVHFMEVFLLTPLLSVISGLEVVLANGNVLDILGTLRKDNTGYDLKHLFIGSEGSLGIVTKVSILTPPKLPSINLAFLACEDYTSCQVLKHLDGLRDPLPSSRHNFYVLIETTGSMESHDK